MPAPINKNRAAIVLGAGLIAISFASIFIKKCNAPALVIAAYRLGLASVFYLSIARIKKRRTWRVFTAQQRKVAIVSGLFLALHFAAWITSLKYTSVISSVVLVQSAPVFVALGSYLILKERFSTLMLAGTLVSLAGSLLIAISDFSQNQSSLAGNLLAIGGAIGAAGYFLAGRRLRPQIDTLTYVSAVYSCAAVILLALSFLSGASLIGYDINTYVLFLALALIPQVIGHTSLNWALKYFSATAVAVITLGEPIGASILAFFILGELPGPGTILGAAVILSGVLAVLYAEGREYQNWEDV